MSSSKMEMDYWKLDGIYKMSPELFYNDDEYPCSFLLYPPEAAMDGGKDSLATCIIVCGGAVLKRPNEHCIHLIDSDYMFNNGIGIPERDDLPPDLFSSKFIFDCVRQNRVLDIKKYRYTRSKYLRHDPTEILTRRLKWSELHLDKKWPLLAKTREEEKLADKLLATSPNCGQPKVVSVKRGNEPLDWPSSNKQHDPDFRAPKNRRCDQSVVVLEKYEKSTPTSATKEIAQAKPLTASEKHRGQLSSAILKKHPQTLILDKHLERKPPSKEPELRQRPLTNFEECPQGELIYSGPSRNHSSKDSSRSYWSFSPSHYVSPAHIPRAVSPILDIAINDVSDAGSPSPSRPVAVVLGTKRVRRDQEVL